MHERYIVLKTVIALINNYLIPNRYIKLVAILRCQSKLHIH